jgi:shikimate dehydrogenase
MVKMASRKRESGSKLCGVIGNPLTYSLSPKMHNAAFKELGLDFEYQKFEVPEHQFLSTLDDLKSKSFRGLSVTMPYKTKIIQYLDKLDNLASEIGAVNTIVNDNGFLTGYNTDAYGAIEALKNNGINVESERHKILILGAGGASRAIAFPLARLGHEIIIANRTFMNGVQLAMELSNITMATVLNIDNVKDIIDNTRIIINCTPVGMKSKSEESPIPIELIKENMVIFDMVYYPKETFLIKEARNIGAKIIYGYDMLLHQGVKAFKLWTGKEPPIQTMKKVVMDELEG